MFVLDCLRGTGSFTSFCPLRMCTNFFWVGGEIGISNRYCRCVNISNDISRGTGIAKMEGSVVTSGSLLGWNKCGDPLIRRTRDEPTENRYRPRRRSSKCTPEVEEEWTLSGVWGGRWDRWDRKRRGHKEVPTYKVIDINRKVNRHQFERHETTSHSRDFRVWNNSSKTLPRILPWTVSFPWVTCLDPFYVHTKLATSSI